MIEIPDVTLVALTGLGYQQDETVWALKKSSEQIKFGEVKYIQLGSVTDIDSWNKAIIYELPKHIFTSHCLLVHADGYIINPTTWKSEWLSYDYAGSPWPLPRDHFSYRDSQGHIQRVGNSVGLRSKKLMDLAATREWRSYYGNTNEDGFIACHNRNWLESEGCKFMPFEEAIYFGKETELPEHTNIQPFLFHEI